MQDTFAELPDALRAAFVLRDLEELSTEEAAETLGVSAGALKVRLHRARLILRADAQEHLATCRNCHVVLDTPQHMIVLRRRSGPQSIPIGRRKVLFQQLQAAFAGRRASG